MENSFFTTRNVRETGLVGHIVLATPLHGRKTVEDRLSMNMNPNGKSRFMKASRLTAVGVGIVVVLGVFVWNNRQTSKDEKKKRDEVKLEERKMMEAGMNERAKIASKGVNDVSATLEVLFGRPWIKTEGELDETAKEAIKNFKTFLQEKLQTQVRVDQHTVLSYSQPTVEVVLFRQEIATDYIYRTTWNGSTKEFQIWGKHLAKAGYNLSSKSTVEIDVDTKEMKIEAKLPEPELISCEQMDFKIIRDENGFWNKLTAQERENAINNLRAKAKEEAKALVIQLKEKTQSEMEKRLKAGDTKEVHVEFRSRAAR